MSQTVSQHDLLAAKHSFTPRTATQPVHPDFIKNQRKRVRPICRGSHSYTWQWMHQLTASHETTAMTIANEIPRKAPPTVNNPSNQSSHLIRPDTIDRSSSKRKNWQIIDATTAAEQVGGRKVESYGKKSKRMEGYGQGSMVLQRDCLTSARTITIRPGHDDNFFRFILRENDFFAM